MRFIVESVVQVKVIKLFFYCHFHSFKSFFCMHNFFYYQKATKKKLSTHVFIHKKKEFLHNNSKSRLFSLEPLNYVITSGCLYVCALLSECEEEYKNWMNFRKKKYTKISQPPFTTSNTMNFRSTWMFSFFFFLLFLHNFSNEFLTDVIWSWETWFRFNCAILFPEFLSIFLKIWNNTCKNLQSFKTSENKIFRFFTSKPDKI